MNRHCVRAAALVLALLTTSSLLAGVNLLATTRAVGDPRPLSAAPALAAPRG